MTVTIFLVARSSSRCLRVLLARHGLLFRSHQPVHSDADPVLRSVGDAGKEEENWRQDGIAHTNRESFEESRVESSLYT